MLSQVKYVSGNDSEQNHKHLATDTCIEAFIKISEPNLNN
jgi:hypothetical protein